VCGFQRQEKLMRRLLVSIVVSLAWMAPALAQDVPQDQCTAPKADQNEGEALKEAVQTIERNLQSRLALQGFTDIQMIPTSYLIRAKDRDGKPVILVLRTESTAEMQAPNQQAVPDDDDSDTPDFQPLATIPSAHVK
jgi:hypothetical protein